MGFLTKVVVGLDIAPSGAYNEPPSGSLPQGEFISPEEVKSMGFPAKSGILWGADDPQNPNYITTVWGFGYKWGF